MNPKTAKALEEHHISFMHGPLQTVFKGMTRLEPFIQFRGGQIDVGSIGAFTYLGCTRSSYRNLSSIGRFCSLGPDVSVGMPAHAITGLSSHSMFTGSWSQQWPELFKEFGWAPDQVAKGRALLREEQGDRWKKGSIGSDVWIGQGAIIMPGIHVGHGAVVAAGAVVTRGVEPYEIVGGVSAKHIRWRFDEATRARLEDLAWWDYGPGVLQGVDWTDVSSALNKIEQAISRGAPKYEPKAVVVSPDDRVLAARAST